MMWPPPVLPDSDQEYEAWLDEVSVGTFDEGFIPARLPGRRNRFQNVAANSSRRDPSAPSRAPLSRVTGAEPPPFGDARLPERFWVKARVDGDGCWTWQGAQTGGGYGQYWNDRNWRAHRVTYVYLVGPIPPEMVVDHLCRNRLCVNPAHLELVTPAENTRRGNSPSGNAVRKTHCKRGHEFTPENTIQYSTGDRRCRTCANARKRQARAEQKAASLGSVAPSSSDGVPWSRDAA